MKRLRFFSFLAAVLIACLAHLPLRWIGVIAVPQTPDFQPVFIGTVWDGAVANVPQIGSIKTKLSLGDMLTGAPPLSFKSSAPYLSFAGTAGLGGAVNVTIDGDMRGLSSVDPRFSGVRGTYEITAEKMVVRETCTSGEGTVSTDVLTKNAALWQWQGPELAGPISCENGDIVMALSGSDRLQDIDAVIRMSFDGTYRAEVEVVSRDERAGSILPLFGFEPLAGSYRLNEAGRWF